ncbi:hypothetical protein BVC71_03410 [Marivivens niveibacter]|uniref:GGDEF-domain containing protein n=1 Tax=Marivivens niveibacter TaxID=1930667 RepID=A0A251X1R6_9RHOB|nr:EAL domain-containing protein [Marivivens niveibacter]OUD10552.1 hypothetical protein BVC71_03410 [Marivivens niveibacter]
MQFVNNFDKIRYQTRFAIHVATRDIAKRLASAAMMMGILWWLGYGKIAAAMWGVVIVYEVIAHLLTRQLPERDEDMSAAYVFLIWLVNCTSVLVYLAPALILAAQPSSAILLAGFLWLFGVFVHITNTFAALPFYNWTLMLPSFGSAFVVFWLASKNTFPPSSDGEWIITSMMMLAYIFNTYETLHKQKDTQRALNAAREEANSRLRALEHLSRHDPLTGLLNRRAFDDELELQLSLRRPTGEVVVYLIDLDGFKPINDTYSHEAGDRVLQVVANRLSKIAENYGVAARLGGDEFALACRSIASEADANQLADEIVRAMNLPITWGEKELNISASIGIGMTRYAGTATESLCAAADQAMYRAKGTAGINKVLYTPEQFQKRLSLEDRIDIVSAMKNGEIRPYYQPKVNLKTRRCIGFEALARWEHPTNGLQFPKTFIPMVNELGLHGDFLIHMASCVLNDVEKLIAEGLDPGQVSINVPEVALATHSGRSDLDDLLARHPKAAKKITLEITEDVFITRSADMIRSSIAYFRGKGLRVSLDDFGTGFASFQHLRELEFDELKIDGSFVSDLGREDTTEVLIGGFLGIARGLGAIVIAEGVETEEQAKHLRELGYNYGQGFLFGRAMPIDETRIRLFADTASLSEASQPLAEPAE